MSSDADLERKVRRQLLAVAMRGIDRCYQPLHGQGPVQMPDLQALVDQVVADNQLSPEARLREALLAAANSADNRTPLLKTTLLAAPAALIYFDIEDRPALVDEEKIYGAVLARLREAAGLPEGPRTDRLTSEIRRRVARQLAALARKSQAIGDTSDVADGLRGVSRSGLEQDILHRLRGPKQPVVLVGEPGNGKTFMAERIAREHFNPERVLRLTGPAVPGGGFERELRTALRQSGTSCQGWDFFACHEHFIESLAAPEFDYDLVVLDNFARGSLGAFPSNVVPSVLVTSQETTEVGALIQVGRYDIDEALDACRLILGEQDEGDVITGLSGHGHALRMLCGVLDYRPGPIDHACRLVVGEHAELWDVIEACMQDAPATLTAAAELLGSHSLVPLAGVYQQLIAGLSDDRWAMDVLLTIAWGNYGDVARVHAFANEGPPRGTEALAIKGAIRRLEKLGIVTVREQAIDMSALTARLVRTLTTDQLGEVARRYLSIVRNHAVELEPSFAAPHNPYRAFLLLDQDVDRAIESGSLEDAVVALRNYAAGDMLFMRRLLSSVLPGRHIEVMMHGQSAILLISQNDCEIFAEIADLEQIAFVEPGAATTIVWQLGLPPKVASASLHEVVTAFTMLYLWWATYQKQVWNVRLGFELVMTEPDGRAHLEATGDGRPLTRTNQVWTVCGKLLSAGTSRKRAPQQAPRCYWCRCPPQQNVAHMQRGLLALADLAHRNGVELGPGVAEGIRHYMLWHASRTPEEIARKDEFLLISNWRDFDWMAPP